MGISILVADNEKDICNILDKFLSGEGHMVMTAVRQVGCRLIGLFISASILRYLNDQ